MNGIKELLLVAPDTQLDRSMLPLIEKWSDVPTSLQLLEVLDNCVYGSLASGLVVTLLQDLYDDTLVSEKKTHEENLPLATWRNGR